MKIIETWLPVKGYEDLYEVSDLGRVRSLNYAKTGEVRVLKPTLYNNGYLVIGLRKDGKLKRFLVHRVVVTSFMGDIPKGMQVNHKNEDKTDNRLSNLEVVTPKENINWGTRNERAAKAKCKELQLTNARTSAKYTFPSSCDASLFFGYKSQSQIGYCIFKARKRKEKFINIRGEKYYFTQSA